MKRVNLIIPESRTTSLREHMDRVPSRVPDSITIVEIAPAKWIFELSDAQKKALYNLFAPRMGASEPQSNNSPQIIFANPRIAKDFVDSYADNIREIMKL